MSISKPAVAVSLALAGGALWAARARKKQKAAVASTVGGHQIVDPFLGPSADPCLGTAYTEVAQPLVADLYMKVGKAAQDLYGGLSVFFIPQNVQGPAFDRLAQLRANEPQVEPVVKVAQELAPNCQWLAPVLEWAPSMVAFRNSLEKLVQIQEADLPPGLRRLPSWATEMVLRNGQSLRLKSGSLVSFELPPGIPGNVAVEASVIPSGGGLLHSLGIYQETLPREQILAIELRPVLASGIPTIFNLTATRSDDGNSTNGSLEIFP